MTPLEPGSTGWAVLYQQEIKSCNEGKPHGAFMHEQREVADALVVYGSSRDYICCFTLHLHCGLRRHEQSHPVACRRAAPAGRSCTSRRSKAATRASLTARSCTSRVMYPWHSLSTAPRSAASRNNCIAGSADMNRANQWLADGPHRLGGPVPAGH